MMHEYSHVEQVGDRVRVYCACGWRSGRRTHLTAALIAFNAHVRNAVRSVTPAS